MALAAMLQSVIALPAGAAVILDGDFDQTLNPGGDLRETRVGLTAPGSLTVTDGSSFNLNSGAGSLDGAFLAFGRRAGGIGTGLVEGVGSSINLRDNANTIADGASVDIGRDSGNGTLTIRNGGSLNVTEPDVPDGADQIGGSNVLTMGRNGGIGTFVVDNGSARISGIGAFMFMGRDEGGLGNASVVNGGSILVKDRGGAGGDGANITVGRNGNSSGNLSVVDSRIAVESANNFAGLFVGRDDLETTGSLLASGIETKIAITGPEAGFTIGRSGQGLATVTNGADVTISGGDSFVSIGREVGASGALTVANGASITVGKPGELDGDIGIGAAFADFGRPAGGTGSLLITGADSQVSVLDSVLIGAPSSLGGGSGSGSVIVSNQATLSASRVLVGAGGILSGNGTINANVSVEGGLVAPGLSPGELMIDGDFTLSDGELVIEIAGLGPGEFDLLNVSGAANFIGGTILFDFIDGFVP
ncbi:hypothetical protein [Denitrobaculum tricleocarpae]|uniref:Autotransporter outer membrane beta-barrel domain-containing protein n=1 Tax=Denitrobaculum tricleocarpae TaxID=2591009 RepID=A0A545TAV7_9PROT|nr:hypothetical protein [Denitrobaculum tricleocarpae]TQV74336.1 hypothetical protein FKG95_23920 [Denitrobaculum tricleocarpae]